MTVALVAYGADSNPAGASPFVAIAVPVGVKAGDLALVALALPATGLVVTPPDTTWIELVQTDPTQAMGMVVFWTVVLNVAQVNWVFALSSSVQATGVAMVYRGADAFVPIDASAALLTGSSATHNIAGVSTSAPAEELVLFIGGAASATYTPASNFIEATHKQQSGSSISAQHRQFAGQGPFAAFSETFGATAAGASVLVALAPSPGLLSYDDAYRRVFETLPPGIDNVLDFTVGTGDFWKLVWSAGAVMKAFVFDLVDLARAEAIAHLSKYKLVDWEGLFGVRGTRTAQIGTIPQRRAQVLGAWRSAAGQGSALPTVQGILGPLLGYNASTPVVIIESDPSALRLLHTYGFTGDLSVAAGQTGMVTIAVGDGGVCSSMGAQLQLAIDTPAALASLVFTLTGPDSTSVTWSGASSTWPTSPLQLYAPAFRKKAIFGNWVLSMTNNSGGTVKLFDGLVLFVEGIGQGQSTGGAIYEWGVYANPAHVGENGAAVDFGAVRLAIKRVSFSHSIGNLIQSLAPYPDVVSGVHAAIPDECCPV